MTVFVSEKFFMLYNPPSRPTPLALYPPNGNPAAPDGDAQLTLTVPDSSALTTRIARLMSWVKTVAYNPNSLSLALAMTSSSSVKVLMTTTGPKISSLTISACSGASAKIVGWTKYPLSPARSPPTRSFADFLPDSMNLVTLLNWILSA